MKLSKIYSNKKDIFEDIKFNQGFNVIIGEVKKPDDMNKDSHNLGKTLLIYLIEFLMLKQLSPQHFLKKRFDRFKEFVFYLEIRLNSGKFLTIKRGVEDDTLISFKKHDVENQDFRDLRSGEWDHFQVSFQKAKELLDSYLGLISIERWSYRKGISYFLRGQKDYRDVFQIDKFVQGKHVEWKPYLAKLLGFDDKIIEEKYILDEKISKKIEELNSLQNKVNTKVEDYDKLKGAIEIKENQIIGAELEVNKFNFYEEELKINKNLVEETEKEIADLSNLLYNIEYEIVDIEEALNVKIKFDLDEIKEVYEESKIYFKENLTKSYEEVLDFKKKLTKERKKYLQERLEKLESQRNKVKRDLFEKNKKRSDILGFIRDDDSFKKFKFFQNNLVSKKAEVLNLKNQLEVLDQVITLNLEMESFSKDRDFLVNKIQKEINEGNPTLRKIRKSFSQIIEKVFNESAIISVKLNQDNNLEFNADILKDEKSLDITSEGEGTSWRKVLCVAFEWN